MIILPNMETCCWLAALGRAAGLDPVWLDYWLMVAAESWVPPIELC